MRIVGDAGRRCFGCARIPHRRERYGTLGSRHPAKPNLLAPQHLMVEVVSGLSRLVRSGSLGERTATAAHGGLLSLPFRLLPYRPYGDRVWELRQNVTAYDAWYIAIAETFGAPLATLDRRLTQAPGPRCDFLTPEV